ncbi:MAG: DUF58 domain-containing protein [Actinomycetota bacterium]|nr:DUF58 domain-containing protein [Actinomycetota bacterium]
MRKLWDNLTIRGNCLVAAGIALVLTGITLGESSLLRAAVFALGVPVIATLFVGRNRFRLSSARSIVPSRTPVGQPATVILRVTNRAEQRSGLLQLDDSVPHVLGGHARFVVDRLPPGASVELRYPVTSALRGRFALGPLRLKLTDPFGLVERSRGFAATEVLTIVPVVHPLPGVGLGGAYSTGGDSSARSVSIQGEDDAATREFRSGDDLRKVHWRSTARVGKLMVRREEQPWQTRSALLLDTRSTAHRGEGMAGSFEWSVSAAASVGDHLSRLGYSLRLFTDAGEIHGVSGLAAREALLDQLAVVRTSTIRTLDHGIRELRAAGEDGLLVCVLGEASPDDAAALIRGRSSTSTSIAVLSDVASYETGSPRRRTRPSQSAQPQSATDIRGAVVGESSAEPRAQFAEPSQQVLATAGVFRRAGWRVVIVPAGVTITDAWAQAGVTAFGYSGTAASSEGFGGTRLTASSTP